LPGATATRFARCRTFIRISFRKPCSMARRSTTYRLCTRS
jgi:hypothetical protein